MTKKLINIKNLLRIVISLMVIFSMAKSCAKAYTFDDFIDFCNQITTLDEANSEQKNCANFILQNQATIKTKLPNYANGDTWLAWSTGTSFYRVTYYEGGNFRGWSYSAGNGIINQETSMGSTAKINNSYWGYDGRNSTFRFGLFNDTMAENIDFTGKIGNNYFSSFDLHFNHGFSEDYTLNGETIQAVPLNYNNSKVFIEDIAPTEEITSIKSYLDDYELEVIDLRYMGNNRKIS